MKPFLPVGSVISERCRCRTEMKGVVGKDGIARFECPNCHSTLEYNVIGKSKGSRFSSSDLKKILTKKGLTITG